MKLKTDDLKEALNIVNQVPTNTIIESSQMMRVSSKGAQVIFELAGEAYSLAQVKNGGGSLSGALFLDRKIVTAFVENATGKEIDFQVSENQAKLVCGGHQATLVLRKPVGGYSPWSFDKGTPLAVADTYLEDLPFLSGCVGETTFDAHLSTVRGLKGCGLVATNGMVVAARTNPAFNTPDFQIPPLVSAQAKAQAKLAIDAKGVGIVLPQGYVYQTFQISTKAYPRKMILDMIHQATGVKALLRVKADDLFQGISYLKKYSTSVELVTAKAKPKGTLYLVCKLGEESLSTGEASTEIAAQVTGELESVWPLKYLEAFLTRILKIESEVEVSFGLTDQDFAVFRATAAKQNYLLISNKR